MSTFAATRAGRGTSTGSTFIGCREWLVVERDTLTHEILSAALARTARSARTARTDKNNGGSA